MVFSSSAIKLCALLATTFVGMANVNQLEALYQVISDGH